jgi:ribosomal protein S27AE
MYHLNQIPSDAQIRKYLRRIVFGKNVFCPNCKSRKVVARQDRYHCTKCRIRFSLLSHTWLANMKLPYEQFWMLLWCWTIEDPILQTTALCGLSEKTVRHWFREFRLHLPKETHILEHIVQLDEAYFTNMALLMAKEKGTRKLAYQVIPGGAVNRGHAANFLFQKVKPNSKLWTDGAAIYKGINRWWPVEHSRDIHKKFEFEHTSEIEGAFGNYRTFVRRMYHHHWSINLDEYVREFCFRFSSPDLFKNPIYYLSKSLSLVPTCS